MGHVQINLFGSFHVERDGKSVDEQLARSPKGMLLMQYLILAPRQTAEAKTLMQVMWPEENSTSPDTALKTLIIALLTKAVTPLQQVYNRDRR